jgi:hypothetical protein
MSTLPLLRLVPGLVVYDTERRYIVVDLLNTTTALVEDDQESVTPNQLPNYSQTTRQQSTDRPHLDLLTIPRRRQGACQHDRRDTTTADREEAGADVPARTSMSELAEKLHNTRQRYTDGCLTTVRGSCRPCCVKYGRTKVKAASIRWLRPLSKPASTGLSDQPTSHTGTNCTPGYGAAWLLPRRLTRNTGCAPRILAIDESLRVRKREGYKAPTSSSSQSSVASLGQTIPGGGADRPHTDGRDRGR